MSKVKEMVKAMITEEQLKTVQDQQAKLTEVLRTLGVLDVTKTKCSRSNSRSYLKR